MERKTVLTCLKCFLVIFNVIFVILGVVGLAVGVVVIVDGKVFTDLLSKINIKVNGLETLADSTIKTGAYLLIAASVVAFIIAFMGCCGAWKEMKSLLTLYAILIITIIGIEIAAFVVSLIYKEQVEKQLSTSWLNKIYREYDGRGAESTSKFSKSMDDLQKKLVCCGVMSPSEYKRDYLKFQRLGHLNGTYPQSCCSNNNCLSIESRQGCFPVLKSKITENFVHVIAFSITLIVTQVVVTVLALTLCCKLRRQAKDF